MQSAGREVDEERLVRGHRMLKSHPCDRLIGHVGHEIVARRMRRLDVRHAVENHRRPLIRLAAEEAIELLETVADRPSRERS